MTHDEALGLIQSLKGNGVELKQIGRILHIQQGAENVSGPLRVLITRNWTEIALAASAHRQTDRLIATASKKRRETAC